MNVSTTLAGNGAILVLSGRFDFSAHRDFRGAYKALLDNPEVKEMLVDFSKVDYMDSSALGMLLLLRQGAEDAGKTVRLRPGEGAVRKVLEIANFAKIFGFA
ncbi:MAG: STAS domain-containing protein [Betaproteobacteria bacterium]|mgnify:CR=1 FL=1|jgi:anti-anti-sigma factor|nr:STAS domain-containing protein [Betaproteobacteria bacterium]